MLAKKISDKFPMDESNHSLCESETNGEYFASKYEHIKSFLSSIHTEKVWSEFKLRDANFNYSIAAESNPEQFNPLISLYELETSLAHFALSGSQESFQIVSKKCNAILEEVHSSVKAISKIAQTETNMANRNSIQSFLIDCQFAEAETLIITASLEIYQKNFMSASHLLLKSWKKFHSIAQKIDHLKQTKNNNDLAMISKPTEKVVPAVTNSDILQNAPSIPSTELTEPVVAMSEAVGTIEVAGSLQATLSDQPSHIAHTAQPSTSQLPNMPTLRPVSTIPPAAVVSLQEVAVVEELDIVSSLERQIDAKTKEIRLKQTNRRGEISEEVIELTKDLLQLKQLYKELKGSWKSSDGHKDVIVNAAKYNNSLLQTSLNNANNMKSSSNDINISGVPQLNVARKLSLVSPPKTLQPRSSVLIHKTLIDIESATAATSADIATSTATAKLSTLKIPTTPPADMVVKQCDPITPVVTSSGTPEICVPTTTAPVPQVQVALFSSPDATSKQRAKPELSIKCSPDSDCSGDGSGSSDDGMDSVMASLTSVSLQQHSPSPKTLDSAASNETTTLLQSECALGCENVADERVNTNVNCDGSQFETDADGENCDPNRHHKLVSSGKSKLSPKQLSGPHSGADEDNSASPVNTIAARQQRLEKQQKAAAREKAREQHRKQQHAKSFSGSSTAHNSSSDATLPSEDSAKPASAFSVPTVYVMIPGLPDLFNYFLSSSASLQDPKKRNLLKKNVSKPSRSAAAKSHVTRKSTSSHNNKTPTKVSHGHSPMKKHTPTRSGAGSSSVNKKLPHNIRINGSSYHSPVKFHSPSPSTSCRKELSSGHKSYFNFENILGSCSSGSNSNSSKSAVAAVTDYNTLYRSQVSAVDKNIVEFEARLAFAIGIFSLLGSVLPSELSWILALISCPNSTTFGLSNLYNVHLFKEGVWSNLASLLLLNLPQSIVTSALRCDSPTNSSSSVFLAQELRNCMACPEQFYSLVEAQSMVYISRNPLYQWTLARNYKVNAQATAGSCLSFRIDRFKRATKACVGALPADDSFFLSFNLAKCCLFSGDWEHAAAMRPADIAKVEANQSQFTSRVVGVAASLALHTLSNFKALKSQYIYNTVTTNMSRVRTTELSFELSKSRTTQQDLEQGKVSRDKAAQDLNVEGDRNYSSLLDLMTKFPPSAVQERETALRDRLDTYLLWGRTFNQSSGCGKTVLQMMASLFKGDADSWLWLLPIEMTYLTFKSEDLVSEANHLKMLMALDQGALMFSDNVLAAGTVHDEDEKNPYRVLASLVNALVLSDLANRDSSAVQASINPKNAVEIYNEKSFLGSTSTLRIKCVARPKPATADNASNSNSSNIYHIIREIKDKTRSITASIGLNLHGKHSGAEESLTGLQVAGDIVLCYLLLRGLVLMELGKAWEAGLMFNLVDSLQMFSTLSKFTVVAANYHMAELVLNFTVCERPLEAATEYLHRASQYLTQTGIRGKVYTGDYCRSIQDLVAKMER